MNPFTIGGIVVAVGLVGALKLGEMARAHERDVAVSERDKSDDKADLICGQARSSFRVYDRKTGKPLPRIEWGKDCKVTVYALQTRVDGEQGRLAEALQVQQRELQDKYAADLAAARRNASHRSNSLKNLEAANAAITNGHYPHEWWVALGDTLGLRGSAQAPALDQSGAAGGRGEGAAAR
jgi:hypothetical protein